MPDLDSIVLLRLGESAITLGGVAVAAVIVLAAAIVAHFARVGLDRLRTRRGRSSSTLYIVEKLVTYGIVVVGIVAGLTAMGLNLSSLAVFAGALGIGVGLGLQGVVKEFVSGLVIIFDRVLNIGDYIELENGTRGLVQEIGPRATRLRNNDNIDILIPNSKLVENQVINWTLRGETRRIHIPFSVAYGVDKVKVRDAVLEAAAQVPFTLPESESRKSQVWLVGFGESSLDFELLVWPTLDAAKRPQAMHAAYTWAIEDALRCAGIEIPFAQQDLRIRSLFGLEGDEALKALNLAPGHHEEAPAAPTPAPNDAAEDLTRSIEERDIEPPDELTQP
ncbi:MAG TPA: mechanosensitive ion channel domain-containing protein [Caulobacteraceae bacterium]|nr:mechanosensitive ion channel domain-containing protein [Caulobacteraceae bacterium]